MKGQVVIRAGIAAAAVLWVMGFYSRPYGWSEWMRRGWEAWQARRLSDHLAASMRRLEALAAVAADEGIDTAAVDWWLRTGADHRLYVFVAREGQWIFWNTHQYPPPRHEIRTAAEGVDTSYGTYIQLPEVREGAVRVVGMVPLTKRIPLIRGRRSEVTALNEWGEGRLSSGEGHPVRLEGRTVGRLRFASLPVAGQRLLSLLWLLGWGILIGLAWWWVPRPWKTAALLGIAISAAVLGNPVGMPDVAIFSPHLFAHAPYVQSLFEGLAWVVAAAALWAVGWQWGARRLRRGGLRWISAAVLMVGGGFFMALLVQEVVENSSLNFSFAGLSRISTAHWLLMGGLLAAFAGWARSVWLVVPHAWFRRRPRWGIVVGLATVWGIGAIGCPSSWVGVCHPLVWMAGLAFAVAVTLVRLEYRLPRRLLAVLPVAIISGGMLPHYQHVKERAQLELVARKLATVRNVEHEYLLLEAERQIRSDALIRRWIQHPHRRPSVEARIRNIHLRQLAIYYQVATFYQASAADSLPRELTYYLHAAEPLDTGGRLWVAYSEDFRVHYLLRVPLAEADFPRLIIWLQPRLTFEESPYFELTRHPTMGLLERFRIRHYAVYHRGRLVRTYGEYPYPRRLENLSSCTGLSSPYRHHLIEVGNANTIVLTRPNDSLWLRVGDFTLPIMMVMLWWALGWLGVLMVRHKGRVRRLLPHTFRGRIQLAFVSIILVMPVVTFIGAPVLMRSAFAENNEKQLVIALRKVYQYLQSNPAPVDATATNVEATESRFHRLGFLLRTDIHLFDFGGELLVSTRPVIFESGILSPLMNPEAYWAFRRRLPVHQVVPEQVGNLRYTAAYLPVVSSDNTVLSFLNISRYVRASDFEDSLNRLLVLMANVSVALLLVMLLISVVITAGLTRPLVLLKQRMASFRLGQAYEPLSWPHDDEFRPVVDTFNRLLKALEESAEALARSERERTWREIAQQVAHEIKNPLTPMRLRIEQLLRRYDPTDPQWQDYFRKTMEALQQQIDLLNRIAGEFSEYARMPQPQPVVMDVRSLLQRTIDTFRDTSHVRIEWQCPAEESTARVDPHHFQQIIVNLIKNAIQAIPPHRTDGKVRVRVEAADGGLLITVEDNGTGIPPEIRDQIFTIRFSTKRRGRGWGLALVERLVSQMRGRIWFESTPGKGTTFYVWFPRT